MLDQQNDPWLAVGDPVTADPAPASLAPAPAQAPAQADPYGAIAEPASDAHPAALDNSGTQYQGGFSDELSAQPQSKMAPEDQAHVVELLRAGHDDLATQFAASKGFDITNGDAIKKAREQTGAVNPDFVTSMPDLKNLPSDLRQGAGMSAARAVLDDIPGAKNLTALTRTIDAKLGLDGTGSTRSFGDEMAYQQDLGTGARQGDQADHPWARFAGQIGGALAIPLGIEGVAARVEAEALSAGATASEARKAASIAVRNRLAISGGSYGGLHGALGADNTTDAITGAVTEGTLGAGGAVALDTLGRAVRPIVAGAGNRLASGFRSATRGFTREGAQDQAAGVLRESATRPIADILGDIANHPDTVSGAKPTLGEISGDTGLAGLQRGHTNSDPLAAATMAERHQANALARTGKVNEALGDGTPQAIQDVGASRLSAGEAATAEQQTARHAAIQARLSSEREGTTAARTAAQNNVADGIVALGATADRDATGSSARQAFDEAYQAAKQRTRDAYQAPALTAAQPLTIPRGLFQKLKKSADDFYGDGGGYIPEQMRSIIDDAAATGTTTRTLTNIDRRLADYAGEARMAGRGREAAFADSFRRDLVDFAQRSAPKEYRDALANAKSIRADQGTRFETGDVASTFARDRYGNASVGDTTVPTRLARPGALGGDTAERLISSIGEGPAENIIRQEIRRVAEEKAIQTAAQARALSVRYGEAAQRFPAIQRDLSALETHAATLDEAHVAERTAQSANPTPEEAASLKEQAALHSAIAGSPLGRVASPDVDPSSFVSSLLRRSDDGRQLRYLHGQIKDNPDAVGGLRRALGDYVVGAGSGPNFNASGDRIPSINKTRAAIDTVVKRAGEALTQQQKLVLKAVSKELEGANFAATAGKPAGSDTSLNNTFKDVMNKIPLIPSKAKFVLNKVLESLGNGAEVKRLITQAILDPDLAATLLKRPTESHWIQVTDKIRPPRSAIGVVSGQGAGQVLQLQQRLADAFTSAPTRLAAQPAGNEAADAQGSAGQQQPEQQGFQP